MQEKIKNIVSKYIKILPGQINSQTVIDRSAVASSIILHRMYAQLLNEGFVINDYTTIKTFGELSTSVNDKETENTFIEQATVSNYSATESTNEPAVGIDAENISSMPVVNDFREDAFYKMNFAPAEMAHCILQPNPYASFAGLFAAKEAIIKADNLYRNKPFNTIIIDHLPEGKPVHPGFQISISHTNETAVAVAVKNISFPASSFATAANTGSNSLLTTIVAIIALSLLTLIFILFKRL